MRFPGFSPLVAALVVVSPVSLLAQDPQSQLWDAAISGDTAALRQAIAGGGKVDSLDTRRARNGRRPLNWAALNNRVPAIQMLLAAGAPLNATNLTGFTPLHHAAEAGAMEAARALLLAGADPHLVTLTGATPARIARAGGFEQLAVMIEAGARGEKPPPTR